ncbi:MAU2 chromatid cohesion factor-like protein, partial [Leptotrombidium deliense]
MSLESAENNYLWLLSLAEGFRTSSPPDIQSCVQCLLAILNINPSPRNAAKTHLQLGNLFIQYTNNSDIAQRHLENAVIIYNQSLIAKQILTKALEESAHSAYWHCKLLFQLAKIHANDREFVNAANVLSAGAGYAEVSNYTRILFLLSQGVMLMIDRRLDEVHPVLTQAGQFLEAWQGSTLQKESLKVFFLVLQVCHHLNAGQVKS